MPRHRLQDVSMVVVACLGLVMSAGVRDSEDKEGKGKASHEEPKNINEEITKKNYDTERGARASSIPPQDNESEAKEGQKRE